MNIPFLKKEVYGILNPKISLEFKFPYLIKRIEIFENNKLYTVKEGNEINYDIISINQQFPKLTKRIKIIIYYNNEKCILLNEKYSYSFRIFKVLSKPFRMMGNFLKRLFKPIIRAISLMWRRHHFLIPPKKFKRYVKSFFQSYRKQQIINFYNPEIKKEYNYWLKEDSIDLIYKKFKFNPLISIIIPVYNANPKVLKECINSVLNQSYKNFEICISDDNSSNKDTIKVLKSFEKNCKIKVKYREKNGMISKCMNSALELANGDYIGFLDNDDVLDKDALYYMVEEINRNNDIDFLYSDEDKIDEHNEYCEPHFKPDWSPDTLLSLNYICHFVLIRKKILDVVGNFRSEFDGAQDYDLFLRVTEVTSNICHIPKILYHWRKSKSSTAANNDNKNYARMAGKKAIEAALNRRKINANVILDSKSPFYIVDYLLKKEPKVSIVIPTKDNKEVLEKCITSIYKNTIYKNFEIIVVDNNTTDIDALNYLKKISKEYKNLKVKKDNREFNYSRINNQAIIGEKTDFIMLLNNDTEVISKKWLTTMVGYASQKHVGCVGAKLLYPDNTIQHAGVILGLGGVASHAYLNSERNEIGYMGRLCVPYNYSANTAACLLVSKSKYEEVNGLEEDLKVAYNDVDFNIKLLEAGYYNVFLPQVELYHYESKTRGYDTDGEKKLRFEREIKYMNDKWKEKVKNDKFYNCNFSYNMWFVLDRRKK